MNTIIDREKLKNNFLKRIELRSCYEGATELEMEGIISSVKDCLKSSGYQKFVSKIASYADLYNDDEMEDSVSEYEVSEDPVKLYEFSYADQRINMKICRYYASLYIDTEEYVNVLDYADGILKVMQIIKERIPFASFLSCYIRKINILRLKNIKKLNSYFNASYFNVLNFPSNQNADSFRAKDSFYNRDGCNYSIERSFIRGILPNGDSCYEVKMNGLAKSYVQDIDISSNPVLNIIKNINVQLFHIYTASLTNSFIEKLCNAEFCDEDIEGVVKNESARNKREVV